MPGIHRTQATMSTRDFKVGNLYRNTDPRGNGWCRHGLVKIVEGSTGRSWAVDTYWGEYGVDGYQRDPFEIQEHLTFLIDLNECRATWREIFEIYADADRAWIPVGGSGAQFFVHNSATPDLERHVEQLERKITECESTSKNALEAAHRYRKELAAILFKASRSKEQA